MDMYDVALMQQMSDNERLLFTSEMAAARKNRNTALLLTLFLGGVGAHRFYLGQTGLGVIYALFCWTFVPAIIACVELFLIMARVDRYNNEQAYAVAAKIRMLASGTAAIPTATATPQHA